MAIPFHLLFVKIKNNLLRLNARIERELTDWGGRQKRRQAEAIRLESNARYQPVSDKNLQAAQARNSQANEEMRQFLQTTLDALPSHVAVLEPDGTIINVSAAWRHFSKENGASSDTGDIGKS